MAERTSVTQLVQLGVESTEGTSVSADVVLPSLSFDLGLDGGIDSFRPTGNKFPTIHTIGKDFVSGPITGKPTYDELNYVFNSVLESVAGVQQSSTTAYKRSYTPSATDEDTVDTFTVEQGSSVRAHKSTGVRIVEIGLKGDRDKVDVSGKFIGRALTDGITMTADPTTVPNIPVLPKEFDIYLDSASGSLGSTKLTRVLSWEWMLGNRAAPLWTVNSANSAYAAFVETANTGTLKLMLEADSNGMGLLTAMRAGTTKFLRIKSTGGQNAGTAIPYSLTIDNAVQIAKPPGPLKDQDGVYAVEWEFNIVYDGGWTHPFLVDLISKTTTL